MQQERIEALTEARRLVGFMALGVSPRREYVGSVMDRMRDQGFGLGDMREPLVVMAAHRTGFLPEAQACSRAADVLGHELLALRELMVDDDLDEDDEGDAPVAERPRH